MIRFQQSDTERERDTRQSIQVVGHCQNDNALLAAKTIENGKSKMPPRTITRLNKSCARSAANCMHQQKMGHYRYADVIKKIQPLFLNTFLPIRTNKNTRLAFSKIQLTLFLAPKIEFCFDSRVSNWQTVKRFGEVTLQPQFKHFNFHLK